MGKSSSPPPAPDYTGAAQATAAGNTEAAKLAQQANLVNQNTPFGSLNYSQDPTSRFQSGNPSYSANIDLSPTGQQLLDQSNQLSTGLFGAQNQALNQVQQQAPMDLSSVNDVATKAYNNYTSRLDPQWQHNQGMTENQLVNQGLHPGMEAYDNAMRDFNNAKNDAYTQANTAAIGTMPQTYQLASATHSQPYNTLASLRTGSQISTPSFSQSPQQANVGGPNYLGAAQAQYGAGLNAYNAQNASNSSFMSGLMGLGGAALGSPAGTFAWMK